jgi:hypothetical protein
MQPHYAVFRQPSVTVARSYGARWLSHSRFLCTPPTSFGRESSDKLTTFLMLIRRSSEEQVETQKSIQDILLYMQL